MKRNFVTFLAIAMFSLASVGAALGQSYEFSGTTTFGDTNDGRTVVASSTNGTAGTVNFNVPTGMTLAQLETLSTDFMTADGCAGGSPRFTVTTNQGSYYDFIINCSGPVTTLTSTGDLTDMNVDVRGVNGYLYNVPFSTVQAQFGAETIQSITLIVDGSWAFDDASQTVTFDNVQINDTEYEFETPGSVNQCKNNGWRAFTDADGNVLYRNQGQCVAFFASGGKSGGKK